MSLDWRGRIEEEDEGFVLVAVKTRGVREILEDLKNGVCFSDRWSTHQECVIHELTM